MLEECPLSEGISDSFFHLSEGLLFFQSNKMLRSHNFLTNEYRQAKVISQTL